MRLLDTAGCDLLNDLGVDDLTGLLLGARHNHLSGLHDRRDKVLGVGISEPRADFFQIYVTAFQLV